MPYCITHDLSVHLSFKFQMHSEMIMMITDWLPYVSSSIFMDYSVRCAYSKKIFYALSYYYYLKSATTYTDPIQIPPLL